jgi:hypothetical protein
LDLDRFAILQGARLLARANPYFLRKKGITMRSILLLVPAFVLACQVDPTDGLDTQDEGTQTEEELTGTDADTDTDDADTDDVDTDDAVSEQNADLLFIREEEKLARDVYDVLGAQYGNQIFLNIRQSEQSHMDALLPHIDRLGLTDPIVDDSTGAFVNPDLQALYTTLIDQGDADLAAALTVGAVIEDLDIVDIANAIERTDDAALITTYETLMCGSRNHLRSYTTQLSRQGTDYTAHYLSPAELEAILAQGNEQCG